MSDFSSTDELLSHSQLTYLHNFILMEEKYLSDAEIEAKLQRPKKKDPDMFCPQGKKIVKLCTNSICNCSAFRCSDMDCPSCGR